METNMNDTLLELELMTKEDMEDYDYERNEFLINKWFKKYRKLERSIMGGPLLLSSSRYKMVWVDESRKSPNGYSSLDKFIDDKDDYYQLAEILKYVSDTISERENAFMTLYYLNRKSDRDIADAIGCSRTFLPKIQKSFVIKFACKIKEAVEIGQTLPDDLEEEFKLYKKN